MRFDENKYLSWYLPRISGDNPPINLHSSGVVGLDPKDFSIVLENPWELSEKFEAALSQWLSIPDDEIVFTPGATGGNLLALLALAPRQSEVIVESPIYEPMLRQTQRLCKTIRLVRSFKNNWRISLDEARRLINDNTALVMITEPNNPSAVFSPREDVLELANLSAKKNATLLINEVYRGFTERPSYHGAVDNIVVVNSLSKLFGTYWMRHGWLSAKTETIAKLKIAHLNMGMPTQPTASLGISVMANARALQEKAKQAAASGFSIVRKWIETTPGLSWCEPHGIGFGCIKLPQGIDDVSFAEKLFEKQNVLIVPGKKFEAPGTFRLSWLQAGADLEEGLKRISAELKNAAA
ncbi:MAG: aminotransferase class I/II-fold pyridoxal phosphate-dependent enzyme [Pseudomonadota bacterium]